MASIPALSSLPNAPHTIYLDFDGDTQAVWNRTDSGQHYTNVNVGEFNIDNTPGFSDAEAAAMRKIWVLGTTIVLHKTYGNLGRTGGVRRNSVN